MEIRRLFFGRFAEESWRSQILKRPIRGYMCVWQATWLGRGKVKRRSSLCSVRSMRLNSFSATIKKKKKQQKINHFLFGICDTAGGTYALYHSVKSILRIYVVSTTSRETGVCSAACEPGGLGGRERGVQVSGPRRPSAHTALEKGWRGCSPRQVSGTWECVEKQCAILFNRVIRHESMPEACINCITVHLKHTFMKPLLAHHEGLQQLQIGALCF